MIYPTVGRIVWFYPSKQDITDGFIIKGPQPCAATIVFIHEMQIVNLRVLDHAGEAWLFEEVLLFTEYRPDGFPERSAEWMPYQKQQAAKDISYREILNQVTDYKS